MKVLDLFSGIGGFSLGLERAGMHTVAFCEIEPFCRKVLDKWWPSIPVWEDIKTLNYCLRKALMSSVVASRAKIYQRPAAVPELPENVVGYGGRCYQPFAWYDHATQLWRTWQRCFLGEWETFSEVWPKAGMTRNGIAYRLMTSVPRIAGKEFGLYVQTPIKSNSVPSKKLRDAENRLPTPKEYLRGVWDRKGQVIYRTPIASDNRDRGNSSSLCVQKRLKKGRQITLSQSLPGTGQLNPRFIEWLMEFPDGHTDCLSASAASSALGNAVVPGIPKLIGDGIMEAYA